MLYALDSNNTDEGSASNVAIASVESAIDAQRDSTFAVEQNSQVDNETPSEVSNQIVWHHGVDITRRRGWFLALGLVRRNDRCFFLETYKR